MDEIKNKVISFNDLVKNSKDNNDNNNDDVNDMEEFFASLEKLLSLDSPQEFKKKTLLNPTFRFLIPVSFFILASKAAT